jgi:hypothetical protein
VAGHASQGQFIENGVVLPQNPSIYDLAFPITRTNEESARFVRILKDAVGGTGLRDVIWDFNIANNSGPAAEAEVMLGSRIPDYSVS